MEESPGQNCNVLKGLYIPFGLKLPWDTRENLEDVDEEDVGVTFCYCGSKQLGLKCSPNESGGQMKAGYCPPSWTSGME